MKKLLSMIIAMIMVFSFSVTAFAAMEGELTGGKITINNAVEGEEYKAYQILYIESYSNVDEDAEDELGNPTGGNYAYKANSAWEAWLKTQTEYVKFDDDGLGYVTWVEGADAAEFAKLAQAEAAKMTADATATAGESGVVEFTNLKLGYYLVDTTLGTLCSLDTTNPTVVMEEKNKIPTITKEVQEDSNGVWGNTNDADIGQDVNFKTTVKAYAGAQNYVVHDRMTDGLTFKPETLVVKVGETALVKDTDYTLNTAPGCCNWNNSAEATENCTFTVTFTKAYLDTITEETTIVLTYSATLDTDAVVAEPEYNDTLLAYGEDSKTAVTETATCTWDIDVLKYGDGDKTDVLANAQFKILNKDKTKAAVIVNGKVTGWDTVDNGTVLITGEDGKIVVDGLDADTYYLNEVKAPDGYNKLKEDKEFTVVAGTKDADNNTIVYTTAIVEVENRSGVELPSTGGMGTTMFYLVGGIMTLGALVVRVARKRMGEAE